MKKFVLILAILLLNAIPSFAKIRDLNSDPYERYNRHAFALNQTLDKFIFKPISVFYRTLVPRPIARSIHRVFKNLGQIPTFFNHVLQGQFRAASIDFWRFTANTTFGLGGLIDIASLLNVPEYQQDFGLTLAKWGYHSSAYLVLPILGPSTVRDTLAWPVHYYANLYPHLSNPTLRHTLVAGHYVDKRTQLLAMDDTLKQITFDPYRFQRDAYLQQRNSHQAANK